MLWSHEIVRKKMSYESTRSYKVPSSQGIPKKVDILQTSYVMHTIVLRTS